MIKIEKVVTPSGEQWDAIIRGMRNPKNSWDRMDSEFWECDHADVYYPCIHIGPNDHKLMSDLTKGGAVHAKYRRMITVYLDITAPLYWWKEFDTYKVGTVSNSCSTMHKIHEKVFTLEDFSCEHFDDYMFDGLSELSFSYVNDEGGYDNWTPSIVLDLIVKALNEAREQFLIADEKLKRKDLTDAERKHVTAQRKYFWWQMIQLLPSSYNQKRTIMLNYEVLVGMYRDRKTHKLDEWQEFCKWIETLPYSELITGPKEEKKPMTNAERIRNMSDEEMVKLLYFGEPFPWCKGTDIADFKNWLRAEVEDEKI